MGASTDQYLNDIALRRWDQCDWSVRHAAVSHGMRSWSLSDTVCVLKVLARKLVRESPGMVEINPNPLDTD